MPLPELPRVREALSTARAALDAARRSREFAARPPLHDGRRRVRSPIDDVPGTARGGERARRRSGRRIGRRHRCSSGRWRSAPLRLLHPVIRAVFAPDGAVDSGARVDRLLSRLEHGRRRRASWTARSFRVPSPPERTTPLPSGPRTASEKLGLVLLCRRWDRGSSPCSYGDRPRSRWAAIDARACRDVCLLPVVPARAASAVSRRRRSRRSGGCASGSRGSPRTASRG